MSFHRFVYLCGWTAVILLTIAGFAAFNADTTIEATAAARTTPSWGGTAGAVSAQGWLAMAGSHSTAAVVVPAEGSTTVGPAPASSSTSPRPRSIPDGSTPWPSAVWLRPTSGPGTSTVPCGWRGVSLASMSTPSTLRPALPVCSRSTPSCGRRPSWKWVSDAADPFDPATNVAVAAHIVYQGDGWTAWDCL